MLIYNQIESILQEIDFPKELIVNYDINSFLEYLEDNKNKGL